MTSKIYMLTFFDPNYDWDRMNYFITHSPYVESYWNYIPLVYCFRASRPVNELRVHFEFLFPRGNFLISEIDPLNMDGRLPTPEAWEWFHRDITSQAIPDGTPKNMLLGK
ncbi:hypothetical protein CCGE525_17695 [Rhizobium jaguaris]|uniref:Uncharacterized protein n=1 Tax=Rhizobium jaguaris TaxID=1312183 RepID=A0A387FRV2_9HYPH|nr:hypothetical protein CCGE525_17695 [Rhizobium jaguaris]